MASHSPWPNQPGFLQTLEGLCPISHRDLGVPKNIQNLAEARKEVEQGQRGSGGRTGGN